jgi:hypothetical protein
MPSTYLPLREAGLNNWLANFADRVAADPALYTLTDSDAAEISAAVAAWQAAYVAAVAPESRTRGIVAAKNAAKRATLATVRRYGALIRAAPEDRVSAALKVDLGLHPRTRDASPIAAPDEAPKVFVADIGQGSHTVRLGRTVDGGKGGKPRGAIGLMLYRAVSEDARVRPDEEGVTFLTMATRGRCVSTFTPADRGKTATYFGRWITAKGKVGPWSCATSASIAA